MLRVMALCPALHYRVGDLRNPYEDTHNEPTVKLDSCPPSSHLLIVGIDNQFKSTSTAVQDYRNQGDAVL